MSPLFKNPTEVFSELFNDYTNYIGFIIILIILSIILLVLVGVPLYYMVNNIAFSSKFFFIIAIVIVCVFIWYVVNNQAWFNKCIEDPAGFWTIITLFVLLPTCGFLYMYRKDLINILFKLATAIHLFDLVDPHSRMLLINCIKDNIGIILAPMFLSVLLYYATRDPNALTNNASSYFLFIVGAMILSFGIYSSLPNFSESPSMLFLVGGVVLLLIAMIVYFYSYITPRVVTIVSNFMRILILLMIVIGLAIGQKVFAERIKSLKGWPGFFANFLFYIPCMVSDGLEYLLQQYKITPNVVFVLLILEVILALGYYYIPVIIQKTISKTSIILQNKPVYLDKERNVGNIEKFLFKPLGDKIVYVENQDRYRRNYCINMWVFLNIEPSSNAAYANETNIFNYNNHPRIAYKNESTSNARLKDRNIYIFYFSNTQDGNVADNGNVSANYEVSIPNQKWNLLTLNYFESKVDLYINGNLERTFYFTNNIPDYASTDSVLLGSDNGLAGAICNVSYNKIPLTAEQIATMYNTNYFKNPPVDFIH
uniref:Uncharacterized protein n=1 Tax=viral metagenome TaxID=1070528 RepID=A0A6C0HHM6_9ZZZZ